MADPGPTNVSRPSETEDDLQASSESFLVELAEIEGLERRKRHMSPEDPQRAPLAHEIEDRTIGLVGLGRYQTRLIEMASQPPPDPEATPRKPGVILTEWRKAERDARDARSAMSRASDLADRLREEHGRSIAHYRARPAAEP